MITRVQQVSAVLTGTSDTVTLPSAPQYGNVLVAVLGRAGAVPIATSLTQANVTWSDTYQGANASVVGHHIWLAQNVGPAAGDTITVTRGDSDDYVVTVIEYAGLRKTGTVTDVTVTAAEDGNSPYTGQTGAPTAEADELFLAVFAHVDTGTQQETPSEGFSQIAQTNEAAADPAGVVLGVYEKIVADIDQPNCVVHTDEWVVWSSRLFTLLTDVTTEATVTAALDSYLVETRTVAVTLDQYVADTYQVTADLDLKISPILQAGIQVFIGGDGARFADLDVSLDTQLDRRALLDVAILGESQQTAVLEVNVRLEPFLRFSSVDVLVSAVDIRKSAQLDVAILYQRPVTNIFTTPEGSAYLACRPLWCNVPRPASVWSFFDVNVGGAGLLSAQMDLHIQTGRTRNATLQVFIAPEP
jgi:hypothetical protein